MKRGLKNKLTVKRISSSPYFSPDFLDKEKNTILHLTGAEMLPPNSFDLASILITNTHTDVSSISIEQLEYCQLMIHPNSGYDNFSTSFIKTAHFPIVIGNPIRASAVTNFILSAIFSHYSPIPNQTTWSHSRQWQRKLLSELSFLILGQGHIGTLLNKSLSPLAKEVRLFDPYAGFPVLDLKNIDVVIPACSLNEKNHHFINKDFLLALNEDFLLINAARGSLVNSSDLQEALAVRPNAFAILDVFEKEPVDFKQFKKTKNISLSSHIAGVYKNIDTATVDFETKVILDFINSDEQVFEKNYKTMILKNRIIDSQFLI